MESVLESGRQRCDWGGGAGGTSPSEPIAAVLPWDLPWDLGPRSWPWCLLAFSESEQRLFWSLRSAPLLWGMALPSVPLPIHTPNPFC